jgi:hypothetical protein
MLKNAHALANRGRGINVQGCAETLGQPRHWNFFAAEYGARLPAK